MILASRFPFLSNEGEKNMYFHPKLAGPLLLMTSYLIAIATENH